MPLTLSLATHADLPAIVRAQYAAFHPNDTLHVLVYPSPFPVPESVIEKTVQRQKENWKSNVTWLKVTDDETGTIVAGAKWLFWPKNGEWVAKEEEGKRWPGSFDEEAVRKMRREEEEGDVLEGRVGKGVDDREFVAWVMGRFMGRRGERVQGPAALLDMCFVHPEWQGRGVGKLLVKWGTEKADELGLKGFVEASPLGRPLYEKFGFVVDEHVLLKGGSVKEEWRDYIVPEYYWMERPLKEVAAVKS
jgi:GNAT superfamily N-acetyltransferase